MKGGNLDFYLIEFNNEKYFDITCKEGLTKLPFNWDKIKTSVKEFILIYSDNDPYDCGIRHGEIIHKNIGGKLIFKKGEGHFNLDAGEKYRQFPELLEYLD